jgi:hypothetical protein
MITPLSAITTEMENVIAADRMCQKHRTYDTACTAIVAMQRFQEVVSRALREAEEEGARWGKDRFVKWEAP